MMNTKECMTNSNPKVAIYARFANEPSKEDELKTALYCRTALACEKTIANQEMILRNYAKENGHGNIAVYSDNGFSGNNLDRPAMLQLQEDAEAGIIGLVLIKDPARVSRNYQDLDDFLDFMYDMGIEVKFSTGDFALSEPFSDMLKKRQGIYQYYLKTKKRTTAV